MRVLKKILTTLVWAVIIIYVAVIIMVSLPSTQRWIGKEVSRALAETLGTEVSVGRINFGLLNKVVVDDVVIHDRNGKRMVRASRVAAKLDYYELVRNMQVYVSSAQLFGFNGNFYREDESMQPNYQFMLDSLSSGDGTKESTLRLRVNSLIIRNGALRYDNLYVPETPGRFSLDHIDVREISANLTLPHYTPDSVAVSVRRLSLKEGSGLDLRDLRLNVSIDRLRASVTDFRLRLPGTDISIPSLEATYLPDGKGGIDMGSLSYEGTLGESCVALSDLAFLVPALGDFTDPMDIGARIEGGANAAMVSGLSLQARDNSIVLVADVGLADFGRDMSIGASVRQFGCNVPKVKERLDNSMQGGVELPEILERLGDIRYDGMLARRRSVMMVDGRISTDVGDAAVRLSWRDGLVRGGVETGGLDLSALLLDGRFGQLAASIEVECAAGGGRRPEMDLDGTVSRLDFNGYSYRNIEVRGAYGDGAFEGLVSLDDPNAGIVLNGTVDLGDSGRQSSVEALVRHLDPAALGLTSRWEGSSFDLDLVARVQASPGGLGDMRGNLAISGFRMRGGDSYYALDSLLVDMDGGHLRMDADFGHARLEGSYDLATLKESFVSLLHEKLPSLVGRGSGADNNFCLDVRVDRADWLRALLGVPLTLNQPLRLNLEMSDSRRYLSMRCSSRSLSYDGSTYRNVSLGAITLGDTLMVDAGLRRMADDGKGMDLDVSLDAAGDRLAASLEWDNHQKVPMRGRLNAETSFIPGTGGMPGVVVRVGPSEISINDTLWHVRPSTVSYADGDLEVEHFSIDHNRQHVKISGRATRSDSDSIVVDLEDVDVNYLLNLVNFHTVDFKGYASGVACIKSVFFEPEMASDLRIADFRFQDGHMGTLLAKVDWDREAKSIVIDARADDVGDAHTYISGCVSPPNNYIDLGIRAQDTSLAFLEGFCGSFLGIVDARANGALRVSGALNDVNLTGEVVADGDVLVKPINVAFTLAGDTVRFIPDHIVFASDTIRDRLGGVGVVTGELGHSHLTNLTYGIQVDALGMLCYDTPGYGDDSFYGTASGTGTCQIRGGSGRVDIDMDLTPGKGSFLEYDAASPDAISGDEFITWNDATPMEAPGPAEAPDDGEDYRDGLPSRASGTGQARDFWSDFPSDIRLNLVVNATPDATLRVLMDRASNDYIALNGSGAIKASYFNKGSFEMFGTYVVDHGEYKMTVQNIIRKVFSFNEGGTIAFRGDPYNAALDLQAVYTVNGVPLSDLQIGNSFSGSNVRVDCLMNIGGTPLAPRVDFDIDMPTVSSDAEQMVRTLINSEEEMNQQVVYLLGVGRFYIQGGNNSGNQPNQASLAMQSFLSGTISQQVNSLLSAVVKNGNWTFGANISTGSEGFYDAEYEGLLSGRLLNNRLVINGQFGYRDNANATTSFIGDFDINYLLLPNGSISLKVYNQSNDRYFTKSSLNTQGIGLVMKKDFDLLRDMFRSSRKRKGGDK